MSERPSLLECVRECANNDAFVREWARLRGFRLSRSPLEDMIDEATGYGRHIAETFVEDVYDLVWTRLPALPSDQPLPEPGNEP